MATVKMGGGERKTRSKMCPKDDAKIVKNVFFIQIPLGFVKSTFFLFSNELKAEMLQ